MSESPFKRNIEAEKKESSVKGTSITNVTQTIPSRRRQLASRFLFGAKKAGKRSFKISRFLAGKGARAGAKAIERRIPRRALHRKREILAEIARLRKELERL